MRKINSATPAEIKQSRRELTAIPTEKRIDMMRTIGNLSRALPALLEETRNYYLDAEAPYCPAHCCIYSAATGCPLCTDSRTARGLSALNDALDAPPCKPKPTARDRAEALGIAAFAAALLLCQCSSPAVLIALTVLCFIAGTVLAVLAAKGESE